MSDRSQARPGARGAAPGGPRDWILKLLKVALPAGVGVLLAYLFLTPLSKNREISFLLDKNKVAAAEERMKVQSAQYRGQDDKGRPFTVTADKALQVSSADPVVEISGMDGRILLDDGPASIEAQRGRYNMDEQKVDVLGPILFRAADGYSLETRDVTFDFTSQKVASGGRVEGRMPLGRFSAGRIEADLAARTVVLSGRARLHIVQGALR
jgi:lipopolysaccharide export system protein LptC